jgi:hypothetical protein
MYEESKICTEKKTINGRDHMLPSRAEWLVKAQKLPLSGWWMKQRHRIVVLILQCLESIMLCQAIQRRRHIEVWNSCLRSLARRKTNDVEAQFPVLRRVG